MRSGTECAPRTCKCGKRLPAPHVHGGELNYDRNSTGYMKWHCPRCTEMFQVKRNCRNWAITCEHCHTHYVWSWHPKSNGCWKIRSNDPLFDTEEIVVVA